MSKQLWDCLGFLRTCFLLSCIFLSVPSLSFSANTHGTPDTQGEIQAFFGDGFTPYVASGCLPTVPSASLAFPPFGCNGYVRGASADLVYVSQAAIALAVTSTSGLHWIAIHRDTSSAVGGWTRRAGSHYLFQQAATQPADPAGGLVVARVTVAGGVVTAVQSTRPSRSPVSAALTLINVQDYGADPDDPGDDTAAILAAIAAIPGSIDIGSQGTGCLYFPLPKTLTGFYKVSSTLNVSYKFNGCMIAPALLTRGQTDDTTIRRALIKWYGPADMDVILLHGLTGFRLEHISVDCRDIAGTVGIAFGPRQTALSVVKQVTAHHLEVSHCDIGIRHGDYASNGPDVASNTFNDIFLLDNKSAGFAQYSGNGLVNGNNWTLFHNGYAPTVATHGGEAAVLQYGVAVRIVGGSINLTNYVSTGGLDSVEPPTIADIYASSAGVVIDNAWIESHTVALKTDGQPLRGSEVTALLHYNALMTEVLVPTSIQWQASMPLIISGQIFGNIEVQAGTNTLVTDKGVQFILNGQQHGRVPSFTGDALGAPFYTHAYGGFPSGAQRGRLALGLPPRTDLGTALPPAIEQTGRELEVLDTFCTQDVNGESCNTLAIQRGDTSGVGAFHWLGNGYWQGGAIKSHKAGKMSWFTWSGGDISLGQPNIRLLTDEAASAGLTKFSPGATVFSVTYRGTGTGTAPVLGAGIQSLSWANAPPTVGTWAVGDIFFNVNPASGQPPAWMCSVAGTPGTWKPLAAIP